MQINTSYSLDFLISYIVAHLEDLFYPTVVFLHYFPQYHRLTSSFCSTQILRSQR